MFEILDQAHIIVPGFMLVLSRISGMFLTFPVFSSKLINNRIKTSIIIIFTLIIAPSFYTSYPNISSVPELFFLIVKELLTGFSIGFGTSVIFESFNIAGNFMGRQMGLSMARAIDPNSGTQLPIISQILLLLLLLYFIISNGHYLLIETMFENFKLIPLGFAKFPASLGRNIMKTGSSAFTLAIQFAGPTIIFMLLVETAVAFSVRVMPQMNAFFITLPLRIGCGLLAMINSLNIFQLIYSPIYERVVNYIGNTLLQMKAV